MTNTYRSGYQYLSELSGVRQLREKLKKLDYTELFFSLDPQNCLPESPKHEIVHSCLIDRVYPHHTNGDSSPSASFNTEKGIYSCFTYGGGDILWLIEILKETDRVGVLRYLSTFQEVSSGEDPSVFLKELEELLSDEGKSTRMPVYSERVLKPWMMHHPYVLERGISEDTLEEMKVGYDPDEIRIVLPNFFQGKLVGWQKRELTDPRWPRTPRVVYDGKDVTPKYKNSEGFPKATTLYNYDNVDWDREVWVVESPFSVLRGIDLGLNIVGTFGAKVRDEQLSLLKKAPRVITMFDSDEAGWRGALAIHSYLEHYLPVFGLEREVGGDLADLSLEEFKALPAPQLSVFHMIELKKYLSKVELKKKEK